jgi:hypothetical protein
MHSLTQFALRNLMIQQDRGFAPVNNGYSTGTSMYSTRGSVSGGSTGKYNSEFLKAFDFLIVELDYLTRDD